MSDTPRDEPEGDETPDERKARLEDLFERWDQRRDAYMEASPADDDPYEQASRAWRFDPFRLWVTLTLLVCFISGWAMWVTRHEVAYWMQAGAEPVELGDLRDRYEDGERSLDVPSNVYVHAEGLFLTHESQGLRDDDEDDEEVRRFFLCPMFHIVVRTQDPFPDKPTHRAASIEVDPVFLDLLEERRAFPVDLTVTAEATGRLVRAPEAARWHASPIKHFANHARVAPTEMWLLLDGDAPEDYGTFAAVWAVAAGMIAAALGLLFRGWTRRRRR